MDPVRLLVQRVPRPANQSHLPARTVCGGRPTTPAAPHARKERLPTSREGAGDTGLYSNEGRFPKRQRPGRPCKGQCGGPRSLTPASRAVPRKPLRGGNSGRNPRSRARAARAPVACAHPGSLPQLFGAQRADPRVLVVASIERTQPNRKMCKKVKQAAHKQKGI